MDAAKAVKGDGTLSGIVIEDVLIDNPTFSGFQIQGSNRNSASFDAVVVSNSALEGLRSSTSRFTIERGDDDQAW